MALDLTPFRQRYGQASREWEASQQEASRREVLEVPEQGLAVFVLCCVESHCGSLC